MGRSTFKERCGKEARKGGISTSQNFSYAKPTKGPELGGVSGIKRTLFIEAGGRETTGKAGSILQQTTGGLNINTD